jgi:hypothetical protein
MGQISSEDIRRGVQECVSVYAKVRTRTGRVWETIVAVPVRETFPAGYARDYLTRCGYTVLYAYLY